MESLYMIYNEREATLIGIVFNKEDIYEFIDTYCLETSDDYCGEFWVTRCVKGAMGWVPDNDFPMWLEWIYEGMHYYEGEKLPNGRKVQ